MHGEMYFLKALYLRATTVYSSLKHALKTSNIELRNHTEIVVLTRSQGELQSEQFKLLFTSIS